MVEQLNLHQDPQEVFWAMNKKQIINKNKEIIYQEVFMIRKSTLRIYKSLV